MPIGFDEIQVESVPAATIVTLKFREKLDQGDYEAGQVGYGRRTSSSPENRVAA